jgi:four helix bundle protein
MADLQRLLVYRKARNLMKRIDQVLPRVRRRKPRLADQMERAAESVGACIAEGRGRGSDKDFANFLSMAIGSITELEHHLQRALDCGILEVEEHRSLTDDAIEIRKMLFGLKKRLSGTP